MRSIKKLLLLVYYMYTGLKNDMWSWVITRLKDHHRHLQYLQKRSISLILHMVVGFY